MKQFSFPYGHKQLSIELPEDSVKAVLLSHLEEYQPLATELELVEEALAHPYNSSTLADLAVGKKNIVLIASDHTRPVPSKLIVPPMLRELRKGNPEARITILIATGCHRETTREELVSKFGVDIVEREHIVVHDCDDEANLVDLGVLPSGARLRINRLAAEADLLVAEGFIEPHFFAGFSGGRKSILPGICARKTVMGNHCSKFIADEHSRTGVLEGNPIHRDMMAAAEMAHLAFICNVVLNAEHKVIYAVAGAERAAHEAGCAFLSSQARVKPVEADIVFSTNGGSPLDQNIYQSVKGMTAAEACVQKNGCIIMISECADGHGGQAFYDTFKNEKDLIRMEKVFLETPAEETIRDQWQSQIMNRILQRAHVIFVSSAPDEVVRDLHMTPAHSLEEAMNLAREYEKRQGISNPEIVLIPDGVGVIVA